jgi:transketolase
LTTTRPFLVEAPILADLRRDLASREPGSTGFLGLLEEIAACNRINALAAVCAARHGWIGASLSCLDILTVLYARTSVSGASVGDRILLGKGHAAAAQYACLAAIGVLAPEELLRYKQADGPQAHTDRCTPGIEINSGSLGQALSKACGLAYRSGDRVFALLGDGELQEGQNYEAFMSMFGLGLTNLTAIVDCNGIQSDSRVADIKPIPDLRRVLEGFGLRVMEIDGNRIDEVWTCFETLAQTTVPSVVLARTRKGAGIPFMEAESCERRGYAWHGGIPNDSEYRQALTHLRRTVQHVRLQRELDAYLSGNRPETSSPEPRGSLPSTGHAFAAVLERLATQDGGRRLRVLDADLEKPCRLTEFARSFPEQYVEMGIAEQDMVSFAGGLALRGELVPVVNTYAAFFRRACEQVYVNATEGTKIVYAGHYAGLCYTTDGKTHQCTGDLAMMRSVPGMHVFYPTVGVELAAVLAWYLDADRTGPLYLRLHRTPAGWGDSGEPDVDFRPGWGTALRCSGTAENAVLTSGPHLACHCLRATDGFSAATDVWAVPWLRDLSPGFATEIAGRYRSVTVVEEHMETGGLLDEFVGTLARAGAPPALPRIRHLAVNGFTFCTREPMGLYAAFGLTPEQLRHALSPTPESS